MARVDMPAWATMKMFAGEFSASATYTVDAWVSYQGDAWKCHTAVETAGAWTGATNWNKVPLAELMGDISDKVNILASRQCEIVVTCVTQDDVTVTGQTVTLRAGSSAQAEIYDTRAYNGQPVTFSVPKDFRYFVEVSSTLSGHFNPTTVTGTAGANTTNVTLTYSDISHITTYADIKGAMDSITSQAEGRAALVGIEIADTWIDEQGNSYSDPMIVVDVQPVKDAYGAEHLAAIMMRKYATKYDIQFDAPESSAGAYASEATAIGGIYYWGYGKDYAQATTYAVNAFCGYKGGIFKCVTAVSASEAFDPVKWQLMDAKEYLSTSAYTVGDYAKYGGKVYECTTAVETAEAFDDTKWTQVLSSPSFQTGARTALSLSQGATVPYTAWAVILRNDVNNTDIQVTGYNNWELSAVRQYFNSNEAIGLWWHIQHVGDCPPLQLPTVRGYMAGCSAALLQYAKPIRVPVWPWGKSPEYTIDTLWLPSVTQMFGVANDNEGYALKKVVDNCYAASGWTTANIGNTNARRYYRVSATSSMALIWLRSANRSRADNAWGVNTAGYISTGDFLAGGFARVVYAGLPACAIY